MRYALTKLNIVALHKAKSQKTYKQAMSRLVLHFTDSTLSMLEASQTAVLTTCIPIEIDKPFAKERLSKPIKEALLNKALGSCYWFGPNYTLFPRVLFDPTQLEAYYQLNHGQLNSLHHLNYQILEALDLVFIYSIPLWLHDYAQHELQTPMVGHSLARQLQFLSTQNPTERVVILIEATHFVLIAMNQRQLLSCTTNAYQQHSDILYFLLAQHQKLQLDRVSQLDIYDATGHFDLTSFEALRAQFKDFEHYHCSFYDTPTYQNQILCASSEDL